MAGRAQPVSKPLAIAGTAALLLVALLIFLPLIALWLRAEGGQGLGRADWSAIRFTLLQATLSALISCSVGLFAARALARHDFPGRGLLVTLFGAPFILPVIVAVLGLLAVWGRSGLVSQTLMAVGLPRLDIYGLEGVLLAHAFFNIPLATRMVLQGWDRIPAEHFRLAEQLDMKPGAVFWLLELPMLRQVLPGALLVIFLICISSFAVALTLGGGPRATTVELAIYQAVRFDFDLGKAALLALVQFGLCAAAAAAALRFSSELSSGAGLARETRWRGDLTPGQRFLDVVSLLAVSLLLLVPLAVVVSQGLGALPQLPAQVVPALGTSLTVAALSVLLAALTGIPLALWIARLTQVRGRMVEGVVLLALATSPFVLGAGLFVLIYRIADPFAVAVPVTAAVNALMALPFVLRVLLPAVRKVNADHGLVADSLGVHGLDRFRIVTLPLIRRPLGFALGLAGALSIGDLGVITLFAPPDVETLPLLMYRLVGAYRMQAASVVALVLVATAFAVFWAFDRGGRRGYSL